MVLIHGAYTAAGLLAGTFLSIFLWRTTQDLSAIAIYSAASAFMIPLAFIANGVLWRGLPAGGSVRLGLGGNGLVYLLVLVLGHRAADWVLLLGLLKGAAEGFYWSGFHLVSYDTTCDDDRDRYFGVQATLGAMLTATLPPAAGAVIVAGAGWRTPYGGYEIIFGAAAIVLIAAMALAGRLPSASRPKLSLERVLVLARRNPDWQWVTRARLADGFTGSLIGLVLSVMTYLVLRNEQQVGDFNGLMGALSIGTSLGLATLMKPRQRTIYALIGGTMLVLSTLLLPLYMTGAALIVFGLLRALGGPLHANALAPVALQVIDRDPNARTLRYEYIVHSELCLAVGRVLSIGAFLLLAAPINQLLLARIVVVIAGAAPMVIWAAFARVPSPVAPVGDQRALASAA
jgi:YQGE family putative transporter